MYVNRFSNVSSNSHNLYSEEGSQHMFGVSDEYQEQCNTFKHSNTIVGDYEAFRGRQ
jgi:Ulp1 family protease